MIAIKTEANKRIIDLVKPEYIERIPSFVRNHAISKTCQLIAREFPEIYAEFEKSEVSADAQEQMRKIVNDIFEERMAKHHM